MEFLIKSMFPGSRLLTRQDAPGIIACVEDIAKRAGSSAPPVYLFPSRQLNAAIYPAGQAMLLFEGAITKTGSTMKGPPSPALEGILNHEMCHWTNMLKHFGPMVGLLVGSSIVAGGAVYMYDCAQKKQAAAKKDGREIDLMAGFNETVEDMKKKSFWENFKEYYNYNQTPIFSLVGATESQPKGWGEYLKRQMIAVGANAVALATALPLARPFALANEFEADAFAVKMSKHPEAYIKWMEEYKIKAEQSALKMGKRVGNVAAGEHVMETVGRWFSHILNETIMAHPSWAERVVAAKNVLSHIHPTH